MELFDYMKEKNSEALRPLAYRMRPETLSEVVGQEHILGENRLLTRAIRADRLGSVIFFGPPGSGKTTLAKVIANTTKAEFRQINATTSGKKDMEAVVSEAGELLAAYGRKTILFIDEIHRFNKAQQDYLLPFVENGTLTLIGATTENPYFEVNRALISRSRLFELKPLSKDDIKTLILRALSDEKKGMGAYHAKIDEDALDFLSDISSGDARIALNAAELAVLTSERTASGTLTITLDTIEECVEKKAIGYDKQGDNHYDLASAFIKSMRGSDPDAAVYYLSRMLEAGEDINFISRRMIILASEDVGNADPTALPLAVSAAAAAERVGMPEARIPLAQAAIYLASAQKSNASYLAVSKAMKKVRETGSLPIPLYLRDIHYEEEAGAAGKGRFVGNGTGYLYPHDYPGHYVPQEYLPGELSGEVFYEPSGNGYEKDIGEYIKKTKRNPRGEH